MADLPDKSAALGRSWDASGPYGWSPRKVDHQDMRPGGIRWLNAASWEEAPDFVVGHPDDNKAELERMTSAADVDKWGALTRGAYFGHEARRPGLFDDL